MLILLLHTVFQFLVDMKEALKIMAELDRKEKEEEENGKKKTKKTRKNRANLNQINFFSTLGCEITVILFSRKMFLSSIEI